MQSPKLPIDAVGSVLVVEPQIITTAKDTGLLPLGFPEGRGAGVILEFALGAIGDPITGGLKYTVTLQEGNESDGSDLALCGPESVVGAAGRGTNAQGGAFASGIVAVIDEASEDTSVYTIAYVGKKSYVKAFITPANLPADAVAAAKTFGSSTSVVTLTAVTAGARGNDIALEMVNPGGTAALAVTVEGRTIKAALGVTSGSVTTTGAQLATEINNTAAAAALVTASAGGAGAMAVGFDNLAGGVDGAVGVPVCVMARVIRGRYNGAFPGLT